MRACPAMGLLLALSVAAPAAVAAEPKRMEWTVDGDMREALVDAPDGKKRAPVVFVFHGHGSTMEKFARRWPVRKHWPEAVGVYMQGLPTPSRVDPKGKRSGWQSQAGTMKNRDLKFFDAVLNTLREKHRIDRNRVYATGNSNGGGFTYVLYTARPNKLAACALNAAILRYPKNRTLRPVPLLHIAGENDGTAPFAMQKESMAKVREVNRCKDTSVGWGPGCKLYPPKDKTGAPFVSLIHPGGHGGPPRSFELIIKFFKEHRRQRARSAADE